MPKELRPLSLKAIRPSGWIKAQMNRDLEQGFAARLDELTERAASDLFKNQIATSQEQLAWWDSETRGNWLWGYTLLALMAQNPSHHAKVSQLLTDLKACQDSDGYIGIYSREWRYGHPAGENGELWGQSRALLAMLAYYELSGDATFLEAVERATELTIQQYADRSYFEPGKPGNNPGALTGLTHGLCYLDVLEWLYRLTQKVQYKDFGLKLFEDFNLMPLPFENDDLAIANLLNKNTHWHGHAVHTAEHLRQLFIADAFGGDPLLQKAITAALEKLQAYLLPSGALLGDEWVHGMPQPEIGYEYCTSTELLLSLAVALEKSGDLAYGDQVENLVFNAGQGARLADGTAIAYLSSDSKRQATAQMADSFSYLHGQAGRYKYSPTHEDIACCCNPNSLRFMPHYLSRMWLACADGLVATTYGPCELETSVNGVRLLLKEVTNYPFSETINFVVSPAQPTEFTLYFRKPAWSAQTRLTTLTGGQIEETATYLAIRKVWQAGDTLELTFEPTFRLQPYPTGEYALHYGPLQYVLPIEAVLQPIKDYPVAGLHDYNVLPVRIEDAYKVLILEKNLPDYGLQVEKVDTALPDFPWNLAPLRLRVDNTILVPLGSSVLRRAAFPAKES